MAVESELMSATTLLSFAEFEKLPDDDRKRELLEGEIIVSPPPKVRHSDVADRLYRALMPHEQSRGVVHTETGFQLGENTWIQPDVSFIDLEHWQRSDPDDYVQGAPLIAVEVVSPSNTAYELNRKVQLLLEHGGEEVWVVYPKTRSIWVHRRGDSKAECFTGTLTSSVLPDLRLDVGALFA